MTSEMAPFSTSNTNYKAYAGAGIQALQDWYNPASGLFDSTGWWNAANALNAVIDYARQTQTTVYNAMIANTFEKHGAGQFLNDFYDDEGWWALTWVNAYDLTTDLRYLQMAQTIFTDMQGGWDQTCGGGLWWSKERAYKNAIANELFLALATRLHLRTSATATQAESSDSYLNWALREWQWFAQSGLIDREGLINDGLDQRCANNNGVTWTYNQGVILGGLVDLYQITHEQSYLTQAESIANTAIERLVNSQGILTEPAEETGCRDDRPQFKGVFVRNLSLLYQVNHNDAYRRFIARNADVLWQQNRNASSQFGLHWGGPFDTIDASRQTSALDVLNAALPFSGEGILPMNLALHKLALGDSACSADEGPEKAVNGTIANNSKWCSSGTRGRYWLIIDLGALMTVSRIVINHAGAGGEDLALNTRDFSLGISIDSLQWQAAAQIRHNTASMTIHRIAPLDIRFIRLDILVPQSSPQYIAARIYELEAYSQ